MTTDNTADKFDGRDYYDCQDSECLEHESPDDCIGAALDAMASWLPGDSRSDRVASLLADIKRIAPLKVTAYTRTTVDLGKYGKRLAERLNEILNEDEMFAHPDGDRNVLEDVDQTALETAISAAIAPFSSQAKPWHCDKVATREYSAEEVEAMMRARNPDWFEVTP